MSIRKSLENVAHMVREIPYHSKLPDELIHFHIYITDSGHCIMCILKCHWNEALKSDFDNYELSVPVKYVLEKGYEISQDRVIVEAEYDSVFGLKVDSRYFEY